MSIPEPFFGLPVQQTTTVARPPGPDREFEVGLIRTLRSHGQREGAALDSYQRLAKASADPAVQYLVKLIAEDEERHHRVIAEMLNQVESLVEEQTIEPAVPYIRPRVDPALAAETRQLLAFEKADSIELRRLRKELRRASPASLLPLLVGLMIHDTAKHIEILRLIKAYTARS